MSFTQRVKNVLFQSFTFFQDRFVVGPHYDALIDKYLDYKTDIVSLIQAADIWLMRTDFVFEFPRQPCQMLFTWVDFNANPPSLFLQIWKCLCRAQETMGFIIMSLGTLVKSIPADMANDIASAFAGLPQKVIWRHLGNRPSTVGNNTLIMNWIPQNDLLGHPKIKAFVAHGGTNGVQEAIYHGVPIMGVPFSLTS